MLDPWEKAVLADALGERLDGKWAAFEVGLVVPRQNGKGAVLEARELAGLFLFGEELILHSAHEFKTAAEAFRRVLALVQGCDDLERRIQRVATSHGDEGIELRGGQRLRFVARSTGSGRGFSGDTVILDEAYNLSPEALAALLPTMAARPNGQLWYTSSAPQPNEQSAVLRKLCRRGRTGSPALAYTEFCADNKANLDDRRAWKQANPALGIRIDMEFVERERDALGDDEFARERLGIWRDDEDRETVFSTDEWAACEDQRSTIAGPACFAFDVSPDRAWSSIASAGMRADGLPHVEIVAHRPGTGWVADRLTELHERWKPPMVAVDPAGPAGGLLAGITVPVQVVSTREATQACGMFYDDVVEAQLRHIGQPELTQAVADADKRPVGDAWLWSRKGSVGVISPLVAATLARWAAAQPAKKHDSDFFTIGGAA